MTISPTRRRILTGLGVLLGLLLGSVLALGYGPRSLRHGAAKSLRAAIGPPAPPADLLELETPGSGGAHRGKPNFAEVIIPVARAQPAPPPPERPAGLEGVSFVLLLGADNRSDKVVGRTDAMILAAFRHRDGKVAAFSVPRDLWIELPEVGTLHEQGRTHARISSVVRVGEVRVGEGQGMPLLRRTLLEQLGVRVDRYATLDFAGFQALIDELGGIEVDVECPIMDCFWIDGTDGACQMMSIEAGRVHMDGATALMFVRSRHGTGDRDRTRRQQAVILALARELRARGLRGVHKLWRSAEPFVSTDLETDDAIYYGSFALETDLRQVSGFSIKAPLTRRHVTEDGKHVLLLDRAAFDEALAELFEGELPALHGRRTCPEPDAALN